MSMLEAECTRCKEIFVPHGTSPEELIHGEREDGKDCGGIGVIQGLWYTSKDPADDRMVPDITPQEQHGIDHPDCNDPDCEFHHPEVRT